MANTTDVGIPTLLPDRLSLPDQTPTAPFRFLDLAPELRDLVYAELLVFEHSLIKWIPKKIKASALITPEFVKRIDKIRREKTLGVYSCLGLLLSNKQISREATTIFFKHNIFTISDMEEYPTTNAAKDALRRIYLREPYTIENELLSRALKDSVNLRYVSVRTTRNIFSLERTEYKWILEVLQVLNHEDGGLKLLSPVFYDSFEVHGSRRGVPAEKARKFMVGLQGRCSAIARSGMVNFPRTPFEIEGIKVEIEYTISGITTAWIM